LESNGVFGPKFFHVKPQGNGGEVCHARVRPQRAELPESIGPLVEPRVSRVYCDHQLLDPQDPTTREHQLRKPNEDGYSRSAKSWSNCQGRHFRDPQPAAPMLAHFLRIRVLAGQAMRAVLDQRDGACDATVAGRDVLLGRLQQVMPRDPHSISIRVHDARSAIAFVNEPKCPFALVLARCDAVGCRRGQVNARCPPADVQRPLPR
jgi:hypothetical protein